ncbi:MAG: dienelactone hydrolase family protein, partial [Gammaproteobacteria bacterium]|nr:dienelactone hydrolase family protein [Gammaproteobacteria bacterium]
MVELTAADGHRLPVYRDSPEGQPRGGLVMIQEIFGMTEQMKRCADRYAAQGYAVALPAMFDRVEPGLVLGYTEFQRGGQAAQAITEEYLLADTEVSRTSVSDAGKTAIIGYCWGGTAAYIGACLGSFDAAICYY